MKIYNGWISKTNWTLVAAVVITIGNAVVPFMPPATQAVVTALLLSIAGMFHVSGVNKAAIASADASAAAGQPVPLGGQK